MGREFPTLHSVLRSQGQIAGDEEEYATPNQSDAVTQLLIAVVDDDVSFLCLVGGRLRSAGYLVASFASARELLAAWPSFSPQYLVLDVHMPDTTAVASRDWRRAQGCDLPVILVTSLDPPKAREHAQRAGSYGLLLKPLDKLSLMSAINRAVGSPPSNLRPGEPQRPTTETGKWICPESTAGQAWRPVRRSMGGTHDLAAAVNHASRPKPETRSLRP